MSIKDIPITKATKTNGLNKKIYQGLLKVHSGKFIQRHNGKNVKNKAFNGVVKKAKTYGRVVDAGGAAVSRAVFNSALKALPRKYKQRRTDLRFLAGSNLIQDFLYANSIGTNQTIPQDIASSIIR